MVPRSRGYVLFRSRRYNEWQSVAYEATTDLQYYTLAEWTDPLKDLVYEVTIDQISHDGSFLDSTDQNHEVDRQYPTEQDREDDQSSHDGFYQRSIDQYRENDQQYSSSHDHGGVKQYSLDERSNDEKNEEDLKKETKHKQELQ